MRTTTFQNHKCVVLENSQLELLIPQSIGPRVLSLKFGGSNNLFAELPNFSTVRPDRQPYHFYGGHRLWLTPEEPMFSYGLDDQPVEISETPNGLLVKKPVEPETAVEKSLLFALDADQPKLTVTHKLVNRGTASIEYSAWAITQFRTGGVAILPQSVTPTQLLPNRSLSLWPYTDLASSSLTIGKECLFLNAQMDTPFKVGYPNPRGWLAYWLDGVLFVKRAGYDPTARYSDFGCSSECYCNNQFIELETLAPLNSLKPGEAVTHVETWELFADIPAPVSEEIIQQIVASLRLDQVNLLF
jgi:hypothetical protein